MSQVVVVGSFNVDHVWRCDTLPLRGQTLAGEYSTTLGGKGFNQAIAAQCVGGVTRFVCSLGDDDGAQSARDFAAQRGLSITAHVAQSATGTAGIWVDESGHNAIVIGAGANAELSAAYVREEQAAIASAKVVLVQLESPLPAITEALQLARNAGVVTILNPAPANAELPAQLLKLVDVLTPNETELQVLSDDASLSATSNDEELHAHCRALLAHGTIIVTLGEEGCFVSHGENQHGDAHAFYRVRANIMKAQDTTGAGDAFNGAFAATFAHDFSFAQRVRMASDYAGLSTQREGAAIAMPSADEVEQYYSWRLNAPHL